VTVALSAAVGAPCGRSIVLFWEESSQTVTGEGELECLSIEGSDVRRTPRIVVGAALIREVGFCAEGEGENLSSGSGGRRGTLRLVVWLYVSRQSSQKGGR
jgi:hypothetical protein